MKGVECVYQQGSRVIYGIHGVCEILGFELQTVGKNKVEYYVLEPVKNPGDRYYVPTQNAAAVAKLKPILTKAELDVLLESPDAGRDTWIDDENQRKQCYRQMINSGDRAALISMVKSLHLHKDAQLAQGRKFHLCDENFLRDAEGLLSAEFALVLNIDPGEVGLYIRNKISGK